MILDYLRRESFKSSPIINSRKMIMAMSQRNWFLSHKIDLMIYPTSNPLSFKTMIPYIFTVHDLNHRIYKEFPEVSAPEEWKGREYNFKNGIGNATLVLVDSEIGKEDILRFYPKEAVPTNKIKVLPFLYADYIREYPENNNEKVRKLYKLPKDYLFYPAQFWPHKNHIRIIKALSRIKSVFNINIPLVLCGTYKDVLQKKTFDTIMYEAKKLKLSQNIYYIGYVEDIYMPSLYKYAKALIMPTFFGPTNIPILEAWRLKCPVITSNIRGIKEQVGNAALLVNPRSANSIAKSIRQIWLDENLRKSLIKLGLERLAIYADKDYNSRLKAIINEAKTKISTKI